MVKIPSLISPPIGFAHRGGRAHARENTMEAFQLAVKMGATGIETDAWLTADQQVVLTHNGVIRRWRWSTPHHIFGQPIANIPCEKLPAHIPTLTNFYEQCSNSSVIPLSIDVKNTSAFDVIISTAKAHNALRSLWICHGDLDVLSSWRKTNPEVNLVHSLYRDKLTYGHERHAADLAQLQINAVNMRYKFWSKGLVTLYHRFGVLAFGWDAHYTHTIEQLLYSGIDAVYSDYVDKLNTTLAKLQ